MRNDSPRVSNDSIASSADGWKLTWTKEGQDDVKVYPRKVGDATWTYIDTEKGLVGDYAYYVHLLKDAALVGQPSDIVSAVHGGR